MAQFDIHRNLNPKTKRLFPYLLNVQSDLLDVVATRVVVPLAPEEVVGRPAQKLNPRLRVEGAALIMDTAEIAGVPRRILGEVVGSLSHRRGEVIAALDILFFGI
jgi:toxin CcdB